MRRRHKRKNHKRFQPAYRRARPKAAAGICPICGCSDLGYGDSGIQDESYIYEWICPACGGSGKECHSLVFDEHIVES